MPKKASRSLLVELLTEELPPKSLLMLGRFFADEVFNGLVERQLKQRDFAGRKVFATPRGLATLVPDVLEAAQDRSTEVSGPSVKAPPEAIAGFARKNGVAIASLEQRETPKGGIYVARVKLKGAVLDAVLADIIGEAIKKLAIRRMMRWGGGDAQFVRPVHSVVMMHGKRVIAGRVFGLDSGNRTQGHRFLGKSPILLRDAGEYEARLAGEGKVIADFERRKVEIDRQLQSEARMQKAGLGVYEDLLDEVTALVEFPVIYAGKFDALYLEVPPECLILTMRQNQKYFPLFDAAGKLLPKFLIVSNMAVADPRHIVSGNERVVRPPLQDARFFYDQDRKVRLEARVAQLARVVYHRKLGSQIERVRRIQRLAGSIARELKANGELAERAAWLAKADLLSGMVGEFPELQGIMGRYYALNDGEAPEIADAIEAHYRPRFAGDRLPDGLLPCPVALAGKLDALVGLFGIR